MKQSFFSACSFFSLSVQNLKVKTYAVIRALTHTHTASFSKSVLNMFVSLSSPTLHMCKNIFAAGLLPQPASHMLPSWPARAPGFLGENQMIRGRNPMLLRLALHSPKPLVIFFPP